LAVIACAALGCGCGDPKCQTVVNAVLATNGSVPPASHKQGERHKGPWIWFARPDWAGCPSLRCVNAGTLSLRISGRLSTTGA